MGQLCAYVQFRMTETRLHHRTGLAIRAATIADTHDVARIHVASWQAAYRGIIADSVLDRLSVQQREQMWRRILVENKLKLLVAESGVGLVGFINFGCARDEDAAELTGEILAIYVDPDSWRLGIGQRLLEAALSQLKSAGFQEATIWVLDSNTRARAFYERNGFWIDGAGKTESTGAAANLKEIRYRRQL